MWPTIVLAGMGTVAYFIRRYLRAMERRGEDRVALTHLSQRVEQLEDALDASQRDIVRLEAAQQFTSRLLTERVQSSQ